MLSERGQTQKRTYCMISVQVRVVVVTLGAGGHEEDFYSAGNALFIVTF